MTKQERLALITQGLEQTYPDADCSLEYRDPWQLLVSAILATQCTDKRVNMVTPALFERYPTVYDAAAADEEELMGYIRSTGFYNHKARNIIGAAQRICSVFGGNVPDNIDDLVSLPGVGRKIANLIVGDVYKRPAIVVDTHCKRLTYRMGLTKNTDPGENCEWICGKLSRRITALSSVTSLSCSARILHRARPALRRMPGTGGL